MDLLRDLVLPRTDGGALMQAILALAIFAGLGYRFRDRAEMRLLLIGIGLVVSGLLGVRAIH